MQEPQELKPDSNRAGAEPSRQSRWRILSPWLAEAAGSPIVRHPLSLAASARGEEGSRSHAADVQPAEYLTSIYTRTLDRVKNCGLDLEAYFK
jgi:hypothetical protein